MNRFDGGVGRSRGARLFSTALVLGGLLVGLSHLHCTRQYALLMTIKATSLVESFDLRVKDLQSGAIVLERVGEPVDPADPNRDISRPGEALKVAVEFGGSGNYLVYVLGRAGQGSANQQFALKDFQVDDVREVSLTLLPLVADADGDGYPACNSPDINCGRVGCAFLDCDDGDPLVHPFGHEVCGNGKDDDCSGRCSAAPGEGDETCVDSDGDGVPTPRDCDDDDPCRSPELKEDQNLCETKADAFPALPKACLDKLAKEGKQLAAPYCGDNVDQDCNGQDVACKVDEDCDGFSPPADCNDKAAAINPGAKESCDGVDNNCNKIVDEGCVPCDVDGDGHALPEVTDPDCKDEQGQPLPRDDTDDYDSAVFPGSTADSGGAEGGTVVGALRGYCSYELEKNGQRRHRDVDHDADGTAASGDGCPAENCDKDGDGFPGAQCSPPKSDEDCNDDDAQTFPGAPDLCGDGIKQNCVADVPCAQVTDKDGDGYPEGVDCDDNPASAAAKETHPWALEKCDGLDNDCDGLVDEGNPGADGTPIRSDVELCNDNNEGQCGGGGISSTQVCTPGSPGCSEGGRKLSGRCACSKIKPNSVRDEGNRVQCPGEALDVDASPRCFGATQPEVERCDADDWDCNGAPDDPAGKNPLSDQGKTCGTNVGNCKAGVVVGCDLSLQLPEADLIEKVLAGHKREFNRRWVCGPAAGQTEVWLPTAERCDGKDDDCDGDLPTNEADPDTDKHIACGGCTIGAGRLDLDPALKGCGDCNNGAAAIYPGAPELCNNIDDNCAAGTSDDGAGECTGGTTCCSDQKACKALQTDKFNCGGCGTVCPAGISDTCVNGGCGCGGGSTCGPGLNCEGGSCQCIQGGRCSGCCDGNTCRTGDAVGACGTGGEACDNCVDGNECTRDVCSGGNCSNPNEASTVECQSGAGNCLAGSCCAGCIGGGSCRTGDTVAFCGDNGDACAVCSTTNVCLAPVCSAGGTCGTVTANDGGACNGGTGTCHGGVCCDGARCWDGSACVASNVSHCGVNGGACASCGTTSTCLAPTCSVAGSCSTAPTNEGASCNSSTGTCRTGICCDGSRCWTGSNCVSSASATCGSAGEPCDTCTALESCSGGDCDCTGGCLSGTSCVDGTSLTACGPAGGTCANCTVTDPPGVCLPNKSCCNGCVKNGTTCVAGTADNECGTGGEACTNCGALPCIGGDCGCPAGQCYNGVSCVVGSTAAACGTSGTCQDCNTVLTLGECEEASCDAGTCKAVDKQPDGEICSSGVCCGGTCCSVDCCDAGACCGGTDCCDGTDCVSGTGDKTCGTAGATCTDCTLITQECKTGGVCGPP